ncbi:MAG: phosphodiester glycosidase family protein [Candidatus Eremiobacteraeota bacterium]|nr:phosphodiester glycosidase family protein [Candidatus Eremiobacteraeota bacterium]
MRSSVFFLLSLTTLAVADEPSGFIFPTWQRTASGIKMVTSQKPSSVYFRRLPEKLVIEFAGVQARGGTPGAPSVPGINDIRWRQLDLSHVACEIGLNYRIPATQLKVTGSGVEIALDYSWEDRIRLSPAVVWTRMERAQGGRYLLWNQLLVDPSDAGASLEIGLAKERTDSREKPTEMIARLGALAGVNGGYFADSGGPLGVVYRGGKLVSPHVGRRPPRTTLGVMKDHSITFDQMVAQKGQLASRSGETWSDVELALGGGPRLLRRGQVALTTDEEELGPKGNDITRVTARTAVGTTKDGKVLIATASGYNDNHLQGLRLEEVAGELLRRGGSEAMNLDGGASTVMAVADQVVSTGPGSPRLEKAVATTLLVRDPRAQGYPYRVQLTCSDSELPADGSSRLKLEARVTDAQGRPAADGVPVRFYAERLGLSKAVANTVNGTAAVEGFSLASPGNAKVFADCAAARGQAETKLAAGPAGRLWTLLQPVASMPGKYSLTVQAVDRWQNGVRNVSLTLLDKSQMTGANGQTTFEVLQVPGSPGRTLTVTGDGGLSVSVAVPAGPALPVPSPSPSPSPAPTPTTDGTSIE